MRRQHFEIEFIRLATFFLLMAISSSSISVATVLAVIQTDDGYWIAADSKRGTGRVVTDSVCKIHETNIGVIAKASADKGWTKNGIDYSLDAEIAGLVEKRQSAAEFKEKLKTSYEQEIWDQLAYQIKLP